MKANTAAIEAAQVNRDTLFVEDATIISIESYPGEQYVIGMTAPKTAAAAVPGSFAHIR